jgi:mannose-6-phosphate isomerase-like protein (cupin superfamily)
MIKRPRTIICDIDGVIFKYFGDICFQHLTVPEILPGAYEKFKEWDVEGCHIILMTGRRESTRKETEKQLSNAGIFYDKLVMGVGGGVRVLVNDKKPEGDNTTRMVCLERNDGLKSMNAPTDDPISLNEGAVNYIEKPWGSETIIESNPNYTMKKLFMKKGHKCSLQLHEFKHETIYVLDGVLRLWLGNDGDYVDFIKGQTFVIEPHVTHRMEGVEDCYYIESSTSELDDVVRIEDDYGRD